jgi:hypothetical protein
MHRAVTALLGPTNTGKVDEREAPDAEPEPGGPREHQPGLQEVAGTLEEAVDRLLHRARLGDRNGPVTESVAQVLLARPIQAFAWRFAAGSRDDFDRLLSCGVE